ncbi:MAG: hypothetical protein RBS34_07190 [Desulfofustis sp.]|jgi:hypothetical protein|nr:hypothetical protein [Desulfofustis sp.]
MDIKNLFVSAWQHTVTFIGPVLLVTFVQMVLIVVSLGVLAPVTTAGYVQSLLLAVREGRPPEIKDLFSQMKLFFPLLLLFIALAIVIFIGFSFLVLPGFVAAGVIAFAAFYLLPLMTDQGLGVLDALKKSWEIAVRPPITDHVIVAIVYVAIMSLGGSLPFAFLLTQPLATFIQVAAYQERVALPEKRETPQPMSAPPPPPPPETGNEIREKSE